MVSLIWHSESTAAVVTQLQTDRASGLSAETAAQRRRTGEDTRSARAAHPSFLRRFWARLKSPAVLLLLAAALLSLVIALHQFFTGNRQANWWEPAAVLVLALLRCLLSVVGDARASRALGALETHATPTARVWRDGAETAIPAAELVAGDVVRVTAGDLIPADCRLLEDTELRCDESPLTGDPLPAEKDAAAIVPAIAPLNERVNMLYAGCAVVHGQGRAVVVETGARTEAGKAAALQPQKPEAALPLQESLVRLAHRLALPLTVLAVAIFVLALVVDLPLLSAMLLALAFAVAVFPQELPSFAPAAFAPGIRRMARQGAAVRHPEAVEALGRVAVLCSDKTGSFTQNDMTLVRAFVGDHMVKLDDNRMPPDVNTLLQLAVLCTDSELRHTDEGEVATGDPTEAAIVTYALHHDMNKADLSAAYPRLGEIPFDPDRRRMTAIHLIEGRHVVIVKGAPETLLPLCGTVSEAAHDAEDFMEAGALRVLAVAYKYIDEAPAHCFADELEQGLSFLGLLGFSDPPRPEAVAAVAECRAAGIRPVMLTGDNLTTATSVARRLELLDSPDQAITGDALSALSDEEAARVTVCARTAAADKVRLVTAWQKQGAPVALTGDGASDIPALRAAEVGCAMPRGSADVTVAAADVVLTDDRFSTLVCAVRESRAVFLNLRRTVQYWLARHISTVLLIVVSLIGWGRSPLSAATLLWISLVTGVLPMWALGAEPAGRDAMRRPPRAKGEGLLTGGVGLSAAVGGLVLAALAIAALAIGGTVEAGLSMALAVIGFGQLALLLTLRSPLPLWRSPLLRAPLTWVSLAAGGALLLPLWTVPALRTLCGLAALTAAEARTAALFSLLPLLAAEVVKLIASLIRPKTGKG